MREAHLFWNQIWSVLGFISGPSCLAKISLVGPSGLLIVNRILQQNQELTYGLVSYVSIKIAFCSCVGLKRGGLASCPRLLCR